MNYASSWQDYSFGNFGSTSTGGIGSIGPAFRKALGSLRDHFIPHEHNNYYPHILNQRLLGLLSLLMVMVKIAVLATAFLPAATIYSSAITNDTVLMLTNQSRAEYQLPALSLNSKLALAAQTKANDMAAKGYFAHTTPDGHSPWWFIQNTGYNYITAGENLAVDFTQAENVETAWMNSPGHRANILNKNYEEIGIGIASGQFQGHDTTFVVQMFGTPVGQKITLQSVPTPVAPATAAKPAAAAPAAVSPSAKPAPVAPVASAPAASATPAVLEPSALQPLQIVDTSTTMQNDQMVISVTTAGPAAKVVASYSGGAAMLYPKSDTVWQGTVPLSHLGGENNLSVSAFDIQGHSQQAGVATFAPSIQSNYQFLGEVKGATINVLGTQIDPKAFEQKFYLIMMAGLLTCMVMAIAIKKHIQHISLVANSSFVIVLASLLWMAG